MKRINISIFSLILALVALPSCTKDTTGSEPYDPSSPARKYVSFALPGSMNADMAVFSSQSSPSRFVLDSSKGPGVFSGMITESGKYCFVQPYLESYSMEDDKLDVEIPSRQQAVLGGFDSSAFHQICRSSSFSGTMKPVSRLVTFTLDTECPMDEISLRTSSGKPLAGKRTLYFDSEEAFAGDFTSGKKFSLSMENVNSGEYSFVLPTFSLEEGLSLELVRNSDGRTATLGVTEGLSADATGAINLGVLRGSELSWQKLIPLRFVESPLADGTEWPFNEPESSMTGSFTTLRGNYPIVADNYKGTISEGLRGFVFGSSAGDCITLPALEGHALNGVSIVLSEDGTAGNPCIKNAEGKIIGETWTGSKSAGDSKSWSFLGEHNTVNRIVLSTDPETGGCALRSIILSYRVAADKEYIVRDVTTEAATQIDAKTGKVTFNGKYTASLDEPARYNAGFEYRVKGTDAWTSVNVPEPSQSGFSYEMTGIETEHVYEFRAFARGETDIDTSYGAIMEFEISNSITLSLVFGDASTAATLYNEWHTLWSLDKGNSGLKGPVDKVYKKDGTDYVFTLYADHNIAYRVASSKYYGYCFDYSTTSTDPRYNGWMRLPGVSGMRLSRIEMKLNTKGQFNISSAVNTDNYGDKAYTDGVNINQTSTTVEHKFNLETTKAGERVYICSETRNVTIMYLTLKYVPVK